MRTYMRLLALMTLGVLPGLQTAQAVPDLGKIMIGSTLAAFRQLDNSSLARLQSGIALDISKLNPSERGAIEAAAKASCGESNYTSYIGDSTVNAVIWAQPRFYVELRWRQGATVRSGSLPFDNVLPDLSSAQLFPKQPVKLPLALRPPASADQKQELYGYLRPLAVAALRKADSFPFPLKEFESPDLRPLSALSTQQRDRLDQLYRSFKGSLRMDDPANTSHPPGGRAAVGPPDALSDMKDLVVRFRIKYYVNMKESAHTSKMGLGWALPAQ